MCMHFLAPRMILPRGLKKPIEKLLNNGPLPLRLNGLSCTQHDDP